MARARDPFAGPYTATLLGGAPPARQRRSVLYATRNHDAYHGKRLVVNESAVVAAVSAAAAAADLEFVLFRFENTEASARAFSAAAVVVAPHGGALANIVFCAPGTAVVEIVPAHQTAPRVRVDLVRPGPPLLPTRGRANSVTTQRRRRPRAAATPGARAARRRDG